MPKMPQNAPKLKLELNLYISGDTWICEFLQRHPEVSLKQAQPYNYGMAQTTPQAVHRWLLSMKECVEGKRDCQTLFKWPDRIGNCDESNFRFEGENLFLYEIPYNSTNAW